MLPAIIFKNQAKEGGKRKQKKAGEEKDWGLTRDTPQTQKKWRRGMPFCKINKQILFLVKPEELQGWLKLHLWFLVDHWYLHFLPSTREVTGTRRCMHTCTYVHTHTYTTLFLWTMSRTALMALT